MVRDFGATQELGPNQRPGAMQNWFPEHYKAYKTCLETLQKEYPDLKMPSGNSIFPAMTLNLGPLTSCWPHVDQLNLAFGICLDWILGRFDKRMGGQLVLHNAKEILELGPGRVVLFPSASVIHESLPISGEGECRYGVTGYIAGGFWRWINQRFMSQELWREKFPVDAKAHDADASNRWKQGCNMFKTLDELIDLVKAMVRGFRNILVSAVLKFS